MYTGYTKEQFKVGDWFTCAYDEHRFICEVVEIRGDYMLTKTQHGYRSLKFRKLRNVTDAN